jgi:REP element-mobilizing transposase RayT
MSRNYYAEINLHLTWHTKDSFPLLVPKVENVAHHALRGKCVNTPGVFVHALGGIETHVHLCVSVAPTITPSEFIGQLKGSSSHEVNQKLGGKVLEWQTGYGIVSFGTRDLNGSRPTSPTSASDMQPGKLWIAWNGLRKSNQRLKPNRDKPPEGGSKTGTLAPSTRPQGRAYTASAESPLKGAWSVALSPTSLFAGGRNKCTTPAGLL